MTSVAVSLAASLHEVRERTLALLAPLSDAQLVGQHSPLMSPLVWDLGHVANYEDIWLVRGGEAGADPLDDLYDAFRHPRKDRHALPIPGAAEARAYAREVRERVLAGLAGQDPFFCAMVVQHEHQHDETILAALQLLPAPGYPPARPEFRSGTNREPKIGRGFVPDRKNAARRDASSEVLLPGGTFVMGTSTDPVALDNERPAHPIDLEPFWLDTTPVTNAQFADFIADGGYDEPRWWNDSGWKWRQEAALTAPQFWSGDTSGDTRTRFGWVETRPLDEPVQHVCWYETDAYARWAGKRLPTEAEWEFAAGNGGTTPWPWGASEPTAAVADLWTWPSSFGPGPVAAHPAGANQWGIHDLIGGVWEWTSSDFNGHPGFEAWPYREYSEVFFGPEYKVLRGGSWATHPTAMRVTFRNWDYPIRRQIFAGFRCARSV
jgi:iron(II)-dependent oxidoreductase